MPEGLAQWGPELFMMRERERRRGLAPEDSAGKDVARRGFEPCLLALLRLSVSGDPGTGLTGGRALRALARTGHLVRAAELVHTISDELERSKEHLALVEAAARAGDLCGAQALAESIPVRQLRDEALVALVPEWVRAGDRDRAVALAEGIRYPHSWASVWAMLAKAVADNGDTDAAEALAHTITDRRAQGEALIAVVREAARHGDPDAAEALAHTIAHCTTRARALAAIVELSEPSRARRLAAQIVVLDGWDTVLSVLERIVPRSAAVVAGRLMIRDGV